MENSHKKKVKTAKGDFVVQNSLNIFIYKGDYILKMNQLIGMKDGYSKKRNVHGKETYKQNEEANKGTREKNGITGKKK